MHHYKDPYHPLFADLESMGPVYVEGLDRETAWMSREGFVRIKGDRINGFFHLLIYKRDIFRLSTHLLIIDPNFLGPQHIPLQPQHIPL